MDSANSVDDDQLTQELVCLGVKYGPCDGEWPPEFVEDCRSRILFTYRTGFHGIRRHPEGPSPLRLGAILLTGTIELREFLSDVGWGCMIRTGQSLLANALFNLQFGRDWRFRGALGDRETNLIKMFSDEPEAPYSIHRFVNHAAAHCGKHPGEWFGPSTVASCISSLARAEDSVRVYVSDGMDVYETDLLKIAFGEDASSTSRRWLPLLVICGIRLGLSSINPLYYTGVQALLSSPHSVGIAGGQTSASYYFYGYWGHKLIYHDPHTTKPALASQTAADRLLGVFPANPRCLPLERTDPSMLVGFLLKSEGDYEDWKRHLHAVPMDTRPISVLPGSVKDVRNSLSMTVDEEEDELRDDSNGPSTEEPQAFEFRERAVKVEPPSIREEDTVLIL